jgi:hypothetical protein
MNAVDGQASTQAVSFVPMQGSALYRQYPPKTTTYHPAIPHRTGLDSSILSLRVMRILGSEARRADMPKIGQSVDS